MYLTLIVLFLIICSKTTQRNDKYFISNELQKSSTSSSDDVTHTTAIRHRHIDAPRLLEPSESGHLPTDFLKQFENSMHAKRTSKKNLQDMIVDRVERSRHSDDEVLQQSHASTYNQRVKQLGSSQQHSPRISRTNTYAGRSEKRRRAPTDVTMHANMAETRPIMPQQYRPARPPSYNEACERKEMIKSTSNVSEIEKLKQKANSDRAKQLYMKSLQMHEQEHGSTTSSPTSSKTTTPTHSSSIKQSQHEPSSTVVDGKQKQPTNSNPTNSNNNYIIKTGNKTIKLTRAITPVPLTSPTEPIFYQPSNHGQSSHKQTSSSSLSNSFYRPNQPPAYKDAVHSRHVKPDLIDSLGGESMV